jgi:hypothetical protein
MKKYLLGLTALTIGTSAFAAVPDVSSAIGDITGSAVPLAAIGGAVLAIIIGIKMYKKFRGAV